MTLYNINERDRVNDFLLRIFNYYHHKICIFNEAVLIIDWSEYNNGDHMGCTGNPGVIIVYPKMIWKKSFNDEYWFTYNCINTIIHELYHADQFAHYKYQPDKIEYTKSLEYPVELNVIYYMSINKKEMLEVFDFEDKTTIDEYNYVLDTIKFSAPYYPYIRRNILTHLYSIIEEITPEDQLLTIHELVFKYFPIIDTITVEVTYPVHGDMNFENFYYKDFIIKSNGLFSNIADINRNFYETIFNYNYRNPVTLKYKLYPSAKRLEIYFLLLCKHMITLDPNFNGGNN